MVPTAVDVARALLWLATQEKKTVTNLRLQKLLYYVQRESLLRRGEPAFLEQIRAFQHGPVVHEVWQKFRCENEPIPSAGIEPGVHGEAFQLVAAVWDEFKSYSDSELRMMTHQEPVWKAHYSTRRVDPSHDLMPRDEILESGRIRRQPPMSNERAKQLIQKFSPPERWFDEPSPFQR